MNILTTGSSGFIGRHVLKLLMQSEHNIALITRYQATADSRLTIIEGDLNSFSDIKKKVIDYKPDVIVHLAWQGIPDFSEKMCKNNLAMAINFFDQILDNTKCKKVIVAGSCFEYGKKQGVCNESDKVNIDSYFTWAKHALNQYLSIKCAENNLALTWFRLFYVYGPGQREGALIPTLIKSIANKEVPKIKTPMNKNDFVYIGDVASSIVKAVDIELPSGLYNLGSGYAASVHEICQIVEKLLLGSASISKQVLGNGQSEEKVNFWANMQKTNKLLNPNIITDLKNGIKKQIEPYG